MAEHRGQAEPNGDLPTMTGPATYRIRVRGRLDPEESSRLCGLSIRPDAGETTTIEGELPDQAALAGVLNTLYSRLLPVLSVEFLRSGDATWRTWGTNGGSR